jgi:HAD superfamily hydrolase (TIGR01490 family)
MAKFKSFAVFDIDGTLIRWQIFHAIFNALGEAGHYQPGDYEQFAAARKEWKARKHDESFKEYEAVMVEAVIRNLTTIPPEDFDRIIDEVFTEYKDQVYCYTRDLIKDLKQKGYVILAISGSLDEAVQRLKAYYDFDDAIGTIHVRSNGAFTGEVIASHSRKDTALRELVVKHNLSFKGSIAVGDSEGDIELLSIVERPIAFNPSKKLFRIAQKRGWDVVIERKNMIYELQTKNGEYSLVRTNA